MFAGDADLSGGAWRAPGLRQPSPAYPAVQPQHERRKYLRDATVLFKFAGLGRYGRRALERAPAAGRGRLRPARDGYGERLPDHALGARPPLAPAKPRPRCWTPWPPTWRYLYREFRTGARAAGAALEEMIRVNTAEGLGDGTGRLRAPEGPAVALDGRMLPA